MVAGAGGPAGLPPAGQTTRWLCGLLLGVSVLGTWAQRSVGLGADLLIYDADAVRMGQVWRLATYAFVERNPLSLLISTAILFMFGRWYEGRWGSRETLRFFVASTLGAALLALPLHALLDLTMPFDDLGMAEGPNAAIDAMLVALAVSAPDARIMFGFVLPMSARRMVGVVLGIEVIAGIMTGHATTSITLGAMLMGYLLATGNWRPSVLWARIRRHRRQRQARAGLYVVPPRDRSLN